MKTLDKITGSAVACAQVALKPRVNWRNLTETQVFLCLTDERLSGVRVIQNLLAGNIRAVPVHGFKTPGTLESAILEKNWRPTMNYCIKCGDSPYDALSAVNAQLTLLTDILSQAPKIDLSDKAVAGLYWFLNEVKETTSAVLAHHKEA